jgi:hypothetical protein
MGPVLPSPQKAARKFLLLLALGWTLLVLASLSWNSRIVHNNNIERARLVARSFYELNLVFRRWGSLHGGVYVPVRDGLQPNPYLDVPERDVTTTSGRKLTLVNPAWMTRQVFELLSAQKGAPIHSRLTSLKYVNPANRPDAWEAAALRTFGPATTEVSEITEIDGAPYLRLMKPFLTEEACLTCHARQGYRVGDIRGGISISIPLSPHMANEAREQRTLLASHAALWIIGTGGIVLFSRRIATHQQRILESERQYRLLFENNPHPMWVYDLETLRFREVNDAAVVHYGYSRDEFLSMTIRDIRPPEDVGRLLENVGRVTTGIDRAGVWRHRRKDGSLISVEITSHVVDFGGRRAEIVLANDITERLRLEEQLRQAQKMEAVGLLAGGVAHDFNNVLTAVIGYANLIHLKLPSADPLRAYAESILSTAQRAAQLTQSLLAFSRKQVMNPLPVELNAVVQRVSRLLQRLIREDIELRLSLTGERTTVLADSVQIEQVLMNLVTNARDAMPEGGTLTISTGIVRASSDLVASHGTAPPGIYVRLTVADTGIGMDDRTRERIFEPFFTTKDLGKGTGLGLASSYGVIKQHGGIVDVETGPRRGAAFHLYFPQVQASLLAPAPDLSPAVPGGSETVLVAEDDETIRVLIRSILSEFGYAVIEAPDGEEAVRRFLETPDRIGLLLFDVIMPKKSGRAAYEEIREVRPGIRALFVSGYSADIITKEGVLDRGIDVITKPVSPVDLLRKVRDVLDRKDG